MIVVILIVILIGNNHKYNSIIREPESLSYHNISNNSNNSNSSRNFREPESLSYYNVSDDSNNDSSNTYSDNQSNTNARILAQMAWGLGNFASQACGVFPRNRCGGSAESRGGLRRPPFSNVE